jgi:hypothetical protein
MDEVRLTRQETTQAEETEPSRRLRGGDRLSIKSAVSNAVPGVYRFAQHKLNWTDSVLCSALQLDQHLG